jgi:hypothetical protein
MMNPKLMQMLEEAGFIFTPDVMNKLPAFEKLVQLEREACAKLCDEEADDLAKKQDFFGLSTAESLAEAIRSRGKE